MIVPGEPVELRFTKWPGARHWRHDCVWLGSDEHGDWVGQVVGARSHRPGADVLAHTDNVSLVPAGSTEWVATQFPPGHPHGLDVYIDLCWDVAWGSDARTVLTGIDMDLDVLRLRDGGTSLDDEDEFSEHADRWDYPPSVRRRVREVADGLLASVAAHDAPFDGTTAERWLDLLAEVRR